MGNPDARHVRAYGRCTTAPAGSAPLFVAYDFGRNRVYGHVRPKKTRTRFLGLCRFLRSFYPREIRMAIIVDEFSPHLTTRRDQRVGAWPRANNVEIAYTQTNGSWLNRVGSQFTALRYSTDPPCSPHSSRAPQIEIRSLTSVCGGTI